MSGLLGGRSVDARAVYEAVRLNRLAHQVIALQAAGVGAAALAAYKPSRLEVVRFASQR